MSGSALESRAERWSKLSSVLPSAREALDEVISFGSTASIHETEIDVRDAFAASQLTLPGYNTVNEVLIREIQSKVHVMLDYVADTTKRRPCSFLLTAEPGSGKSYFVKCVSGECGLPVVSANISTMNSIGELGFWIDQARNHKAEDQIPVLFIDEADSKPTEVAAFLPLLWDGVFYCQGRSLRIGRCLIMLAVSDPALRKFVEDGTEENKVKKNYNKIDDLLSRISGGVSKISSVDERRLDKLCISLALIRRRFPRIKGVQIPYIKLLVNTHFLHSVRSMEALIGHLPSPRPDGFLRVESEFEEKLLFEFLEKKNFRANVFSFHLSNESRVNAKQTWTEFKACETVVVF
jgi:hypothetical protein